MKNIAIFVSGEGEAAQRIIRLFNDGNRLKTVLLIADDSAVQVLEEVTDPDVKKLHIPDAEWHQRSGEVASMLTAEHIDLIVLDQFSESISDEIMEAVNGEVVRVSGVELAPREVVAAVEADLRKPAEESQETVKEPEGAPSLESEWADALKIQYTPPKIPTTPPEIPGQEEKPEEIVVEAIEPEESKPWMQNRLYHENHSKEFRKEERREHDEPMPSTWLIWSVLVTVFCCFIPGIIAIIFSSQVSSRYYAGDVEGARRSSRMAEIWIIVSFVLGVLSATLYLPFMMLN